MNDAMAKVRDALVWIADHGEAGSGVRTRAREALVALDAERVPALDIDAALYPDREVPAHGKLERRVVWALLKHMEAAGFSVVGVHDYEELTRVATPKEAMELVFNLDGCNLHFLEVGRMGRQYCAVLVMGNGTDVLSDWFAHPGDAFDTALKAFDPKAFA